MANKNEQYVETAKAAEIIGHKYLETLKEWTSDASSVDDLDGNTEKVGKFSPTISDMMHKSFGFMGGGNLEIRLLAIELFRAHKDFSLHLILAPRSFEESAKGKLYKMTGETLALIFKLELEQIVRERGLKTVV